MWALGVMAYEAVVDEAAVRSYSEVQDFATGSRRYPWEAPHAELPLRWRRSRLQPLLQTCLARDATHRPTASQLIVSVAQLGNSTAPSC